MSWSDLRQRQEAAMVRARQLTLRSGALCDQTADAVQRLRYERERRWVQRGWLARASYDAGAFVVRGEVDGEAVVGQRLPNGGLTATPVLLQRAQLLVAMRERFDTGDGTSLVATLEQPPTAVLLTLLRAMSSVSAVELDLAPA